MRRNGQLQLSSCLWHVHLPPSLPQSTDHEACAAIGAASPAQLVKFAHAFLFLPALSTLETALAKGYIAIFPGLFLAGLRKHPPQSFPMVKGHLDQTRKSQRSAKPSTTPSPSPLLILMHSHLVEHSTIKNLNGTRSQFCYAALMEPTGQVYSDQTGRFITRSSTGNNYLLILYDLDSNSFLAKPIMTRSSASILAGYHRLHTTLCNAGLRPVLQRLDNKCSAPLKQFSRDEGIDFQLAPPWRLST